MPGRLGPIEVGCEACPRCGGKVEYDPATSGLLARAERHEGRPYWCSYSRVRCPHCGHEWLALRRRQENAGHA